MHSSIYLGKKKKIPSLLYLTIMSLRDFLFSLHTPCLPILHRRGKCLLLPSTSKPIPMSCPFLLTALPFSLRPGLDRSRNICYCLEHIFFPSTWLCTSYSCQRSDVSQSLWQCSIFPNKHQWCLRLESCQSGKTGQLPSWLTDVLITLAQRCWYCK